MQRKKDTLSTRTRVWAKHDSAYSPCYNENIRYKAAKFYLSNMNVSGCRAGK